MDSGLSHELQRKVIQAERAEDEGQEGAGTESEMPAVWDAKQEKGNWGFTDVWDPEPSPRTMKGCASF